MNATEARDLLVRLLRQHQYEQGSLPGTTTGIAAIEPAAEGIAVTFTDGTRVLYAVIVEGGQE